MLPLPLTTAARRTALVGLLAGLAVSLTTTLTSPAPVALSARSTPVGSPVAGTSCRVFPSSSWWHTSVRGLPVHRRSEQWLAHMSPRRSLHPDFGPSYGDGPDYGIPVTVIDDRHARVPVRFDYADESDAITYPFGSDTRIEGGRESSGDRHAVVLNKTHCWLYETWSTREDQGSWSAGSGAHWSLKSNRLRPDGWTSADAAGLPILPGLLRWSEVRAGYVDHPIRFTTDVTSRRHLWPARHDAGSTSDPSYPPMGARFRLKSSFSTAGYSRQAKTVIYAMKRYGLVLADNGSPWFFQGEQNAAWPDSFVAELKRIPASAFEAVDTSSLRVSSDSARVR